MLANTYFASLLSNGSLMVIRKHWGGLGLSGFAPRLRIRSKGGNGSGIRARSETFRASRRSLLLERAIVGDVTLLQQVKIEVDVGLDRIKDTGREGGRTNGSRIRTCWCRLEIQVIDQLG